MLDIEYNPNGPTCYGLSPSAMVAWIQSFVNTYHSKTTRYPMIYSTADWWSTCTGNSNAFSSTCPLVLARYGSSVGKIPGGWPFQTIWQNADKYAYGGDSDIFNGGLPQLKKLASG
jgi:GH25 family lysozyme M1 (1,4-beta-N-acetylmuramidase)